MARFARCSHNGYFPDNSEGYDGTHKHDTSVDNGNVVRVRSFRRLLRHRTATTEILLFVLDPSECYNGTYEESDDGSDGGLLEGRAVAEITLALTHCTTEHNTARG